MKTSKIIFISLLTAIAVFILTVSLDIRFNGIKGVSQKGAQVDLQKYTVPSFNVLLINNSTNIIVIKGGTSYIEVASPKGSPFPVSYKSSGDTLKLSDVKVLLSGNSYLSVKVCFADTLKSIISVDSRLSLERVSAGKMTIKMDNSTLSFSSFAAGESYFRALDIFAKNHSNIRAFEVNVDSLHLSLQSSYANLPFSAKTINGALSDSSNLVTRQPAEISLKRDSTSKIMLNN